MSTEPDEELLDQITVEYLEARRTTLRVERTGIAEERIHGLDHGLSHLRAQRCRGGGVEIDAAREGSSGGD